MKIAFTTCVQLGKSCIEKIYDLGGHLELLITLKDDIAQKKSGRIYLDEFATKNNIPLIKVQNINEEKVIFELKKRKIDWLFVIGWSQIVKKNVLETPKRGCIGMHPTLLPIGRGRAAIPWAIIKQLDKTGVSMFKLDEGVDTGDILGQIEIPLADDITATELYSKVNDAHVELIEKYWNNIIEDSITLIKQKEENASEWPERRPVDGMLTQNMKMDEAECLVRAVTHPYPGAFYIEKGKKIIVWKAEKSYKKTKKSFKLADGYLNILEFTEEDVF